MGKLQSNLRFGSFFHFVLLTNRKHAISCKMPDNVLTRDHKVWEQLGHNRWQVQLITKASREKQSQELATNHRCLKPLVVKWANGFVRYSLFLQCAMLNGMQIRWCVVVHQWTICSWAYFGSGAGTHRIAYSLRTVYFVFLSVNYKARSCSLYRYAMKLQKNYVRK